MHRYRLYLALCLSFTLLVSTVPAQSVFVFQNASSHWGSTATNNWGAGTGVKPGSSVLTTNDDIAFSNTTGAVALDIDFGATGNGVGTPYYLGAIDYATTNGGSNSWTFGSNGSTAGTLQLNSAVVASQPDVYLYSRNVTPTTWNLVTTHNGGTGAMSLGLNATAGRVIVTGDNTVNISAPLTGSGGIVKDGAGTLNLNANNSYLGTTTVNAGTLLINGTHSSADAFTVNGGRLGGSGTINSDTDILNGLVEPGNTTPAILTINGLVTFSSTSAFRAKLTSNSVGSGYDQLAIGSGGALTLNDTTLQIAANFVPLFSDRFFLTDNQSGPISGTFFGLPDGSTVMFSNGFSATITYFGNYLNNTITGGDDVLLYNISVPEPSTYALLGLTGFFGLQYYLRRKSAKAVQPETNSCPA